MSTKYTIEKVKDIFKSRGCELLENEYRSCRDKVKYIAKCGHTCKITLYHFISGRHGDYCEECRRKAKALTLDEVISKFNEANCIPLFSEYKNNRDFVSYIAQCGHKCRIQVGAFLLGKGRICRRCLNQSFRDSVDIVKAEFEREGCKPLFTEYKNKNQKLNYIAKCGHHNAISRYHFKRGVGRICHDCALHSKAYSIEKIRSLLHREGCELLSSKCNGTKDKIVYIARCGHTTISKLSDFIDGCNRVCKDCVSNGVGKLSSNSVYSILKTRYSDVEREYKIITERKFPQWLDFYIPSIKLAIEYNGEQHYRPIKNWGGEVGFEKAKERDAAKRRYCKSKGIVLVEIDGRKYKYNNLTNELVFEMIDRALHAE